jgi:hypothetical protein
MQRGSSLRSWLVAGAAWLALAWAGSAAAAEAIIGSVLGVRGDVYAEAGNERRPLAPNAAVRLGDTIVCGQGKAKIALNDGTVLSIGENSRMRLADHAGVAGGAKTRVNLISGVVRFGVTFTRGGAFEVETETAIAAVRGTDWVMDVTPGQTAVAVVAGVVEVSTRAAVAQPTVVLDGEGQGTDVRQGSAPTPPARWSAQRIASTLARATFD